MIKTLATVVGLTLTTMLGAKGNDSVIAEGKFKPTDESLKTYECPEWFRDAKFGIWSHWGPQAVPRQGDWYARNMYIQDVYNKNKKCYTGKAHRQYLYHLEHYGHPSEFGYKDIIPLWKAERWNPEKLMKLYKKTGARYFVSMGVHHDNFYLWDSQQTPWTSVKMGPKRDVVGEWQNAAKKYGLKFGVSEHLGASYTWYQTSHGADKTGPKAGIPYDGANPEYESLYHKKTEPGDDAWLTTNTEFQKEWFVRIKELIDMYKPDLLYSDSEFPFEDTGRSLVAHLYNVKARKNEKTDAVYTCKKNESYGRYVKDLERGILNEIYPYPWQTDTSIGDWYYREGQKYTTSTEVIQMLVDIVSKNGNLLLNVVQTPEGDLEEDVLNILDGIGKWMDVNGEAIYGTRPWSVFGDGPSLSLNQGKGHHEGVKDVRSYLPGDLRFTQKDNNLYVFAMEHPEQDMIIKSFPADKNIKSIKMLGSKEKIRWEKTAYGLKISVPQNMPDFNTVVFKVSMK